jgi:hypothetical protein
MPGPTGLCKAKPQTGSPPRHRPWGTEGRGQSLGSTIKPAIHICVHT